MKKLYFFLAILVILPGFLAAQTNISGNIANNTTFTLASSPYIVDGNLNVNAGVTLTIESGVEVRVNDGLYIQVFGTMNASGATFTSSTGTNPGAWQGIYVSYHYSADIGTVNLDNCIIEYAQSLFVRKGTLNLSNGTLVKDFSSFGLDIYTEGIVDISNTTIQATSYPVYFRNFQGNGFWTVGENVILTGNNTDYVFIDFRDVNSTFNLPDPGIPYYYNSEFRVTETGTLTIEPGVQLLGNTDAYITVYGKLKAEGTAADSIYFTNEPSNAYWRGFNFMDAAVDTACIMNYCSLTGANYVNGNYRPYEISSCAMEIFSSSPVINNTSFYNNRYNLVISGRSYPTFTNCAFNASTRVAKENFNINMDPNGEPEFNNCSIGFNGSEARAIGLTDATVYGDSRLGHRSFTGLDSITYTLLGNVNVHDTASWTIDPGIVIKVTDNDYYLRAYGSITGIGTESEPIIFTHINDDDYGNPRDTYTDGTTSISSSSSGRIILNGEPTSTLDHWKILYGGLNSSYYAVYAYNDNIVRNCEIRYSHRGILFSHNAQVINNHFANIVNYPLARRFNEGDPVLIGNTLENCGNLGIFVHDVLAGNYSISGLDIGENTNVAYIIDGNMNIPSDAFVTIAAGTVVKFTGYYGKISVYGGLYAAGTPTSKVIFTSINDNSAAGNTNYNTGADPTGNKWDRIEYYDSSDDLFNQLNNAEIRYVRNSLRMNSCKVVVDSSLLNFSDSYALGIYGNANPEITNSRFNNISNAPIHMDMFASPTFSNNSVANIGRMGIAINESTISGTVPARSFAGYDSITYLIYSTLTVNDELTIPAGMVFKGTGSAYFNINGRLNVLGTADNPVVFTTLQDDDYGNPRDTEANGQAGISKNGNRVVFRDVSNDNSVIDHAIFRYSYDYGVYMIGASPTISNTLFQETNRCGLYLAGTSAPTVNNCVFDDLNYPMITALMAFPGSYSGNVLSGTTSKAIAIIDDETLTQDYTMVKRDFAGIVNIPYLFNRYTVGTSAVLTIEPGVILKFMQSGWMNVRNGLIADGGSTADSAIIFTADRDDFYGGDTYGDGDANLAHRQWWWGIYFAEESIDASCLVNNAIVKYASRRYSSSPSIYNRGGITMDNASPTVTNTLFESDYFGIVGRNTSLPHITNCDFIDSDPSGYAIWNETGVVTIVAEDCWWNDVSGPYHPTLNPGGAGERVSNNVDFDPWISQSAKPILGDVSLNGEVMPYDASLVLQHTVGNITLDSRQLDVADVSGNGEVTSYDASLILQYTIGLITGFDQSAKKSVADVLQPMISAPGFFETTQGEAFELPLIITTHAGIKSIDLEIRIDQNQLQFKGLNSEQLPSDLMVASGFNAGTGILKIALTSAYDLDLNMHQLLLRFEASASGEGSSVIEHQRLLANEKEIPEELFAVEVRISNNATNVELAPGLEAMKIFSWEEQIVAELYLSEAQSEIHVSVYDLTGRRINSMAIDHVVPGQHTVTFEAEPGGMGGSPRTYLVHVRGDTFTVTRKLIVR